MSPLFLAQSGALKTRPCPRASCLEAAASTSGKKEAAQRGGFNLEGGLFV
jgi:hypothetical protein